MTHWKLLLLPLALLLPLVAYVAGTLSTGPEGPTRPEPVILQDESDDTPEGRDRDDRTKQDGPADVRRGEDSGRDDGDDRSDDNDDERNDDGPEVVVPSPTRLDDDGLDDDDDDFRGGEGTDDGGDD